MKKQLCPAVKTILEWATPKFNGRLLVTEGVIYGFVPDKTVAQLEKFLKTEYRQRNSAIEAEPRRGYLINLDNGHTVGITRNTSSMRGRPWLAFCGRISDSKPTRPRVGRIERCPPIT